VIAAAEPQREASFPNPWQTVLLATLAGFAVSSAVAAAAASGSAEPGNGEPPPQAVAVVAAAEPAIGRGEDPAPLQTVAARLNPADREDEGPEDVDKRPSFDPFASSGALEAPENLAGRLTRLRTNDGLVVLIARLRSGHALSVALDTARRLSSEGATPLVDLGAQQGWFADIVDREDADQLEIPGLANLLAGQASIGPPTRPASCSRNASNAGRGRAPHTRPQDAGSGRPH
jgi:hypothetical protein